MKNKMKLLLLLFLFIEVGTIGCSENEDNKPLSVEFKDVSVKEAQQFLQGKWKVIQQSGGIAGTTSEVNDRYIEFVGTTTWRITNQNSTADLTITKWEKRNTQGGFGEGLYLTVDGSIPVKLENIHNDTLYYRDAVYDGYDYLAIKVNN